MRGSDNHESDNVQQRRYSRRVTYVGTKSCPVVRFPDGLVASCAHGLDFCTISPHPWQGLIGGSLGAVARPGLRRYIFFILIPLTFRVLQLRQLSARIPSLFPPLFLCPSCTRVPVSECSPSFLWDLFIFVIVAGVFGVQLM